MTITDAPAATAHNVIVDMGAEYGLVTVEVTALTYAEAYRGAVEALLLDPAGTLAAEANARLAETYGS